MKFKALFAIIVVGMSLPVLGMEQAPVPTRLKKIVDCPLQDLRQPENYNLLEEGTTFAVKDNKGYFTVTKVTPYQPHWLWGWAGRNAQYKWFDRPRYYHPTWFPFPLATEYGFASHKKTDKEENLGINIRTIQLPTKRGWMAIGTTCAVLGGMAYVNGLFGRR